MVSRQENMSTRITLAQQQLVAKLQALLESRRVPSKWPRWREDIHPLPAVAEPVAAPERNTDDAWPDADACASSQSSSSTAAISSSAAQQEPSQRKAARIAELQAEIAAAKRLRASAAAAAAAAVLPGGGERMSAGKSRQDSSRSAASGSGIRRQEKGDGVVSSSVSDGRRSSEGIAAGVGFTSVTYADVMRRNSPGSQMHGTPPATWGRRAASAAWSGSRTPAADKHDGAAADVDCLPGERIIYQAGHALGAVANPPSLPPMTADAACAVVWPVQSLQRRSQQAAATGGSGRKAAIDASSLPDREKFMAPPQMSREPSGQSGSAQQGRPCLDSEAGSSTFGWIRRAGQAVSSICKGCLPTIRQVL